MGLQSGLRERKVTALATPMGQANSSGIRGALLVNLGSPAAPTAEAVRAFLDEFLADPLVVDLNPLGWWLLRKLMILPRRSPLVAEQYAKIWTREGSPLVAHTRRQAELLRKELGDSYPVEWAMRYGEPGIAAGLAALSAAGCGEVVLAPLFPQFSRATSGSVEEAARKVLAKGRSVPRLTVLAPFFAAPGFVEAFAERIRAALAEGPVDHVVLSFHGLPVRFIREGDPYQAHCEATAAALARALDLPREGWTLTYQSRFGSEEWLGPATDEVARRLARTSPRLLVACPSFVSDCLETLEEIAVRLRATFLAAGGRELRVAPCLNDHPRWIQALSALVRGA